MKKVTDTLTFILEDNDMRRTFKQIALEHFAKKKRRRKTESKLNRNFNIFKKAASIMLGVCVLFSLGFICIKDNSQIKVKPLELPKEVQTGEASHAKISASVKEFFAANDQDALKSFGITGKIPEFNIISIFAYSSGNAEVLCGLAYSSCRMVISLVPEGSSYKLSRISPE